MRTREIAVIVVTALLLTGCEDTPSTGTVYDRKFHAGYNTYESQCTGYDKNGMCSRSVQVPKWHPDSYELCIEGDKVNTQGWKTRGCREVSKKEYESYHVGDHYPRVK